MDKTNLLNKYPVLDDHAFRMPVASIISLDDKDDLTDDRAMLMELMNDWSDNDDDEFYWEMLRNVKFILEDSTAYTTPDRLISLNYPCTDIIPMDNDRFMRWYFVFCHECLHQLWDTFSVGDEIEAKEGSCDRQLLNIASDCVINDFLDKIDKNHKKKPVAGVYPDVLKDKYGITYDRKVDTQYTLYIKLKRELDKQQQEQLKDEFGDDSPQDGNSQQSGNGGSGKGQKDSKEQKDGKDPKDSGKDGKDQNGSGNGKDQKDNGKDGKDQNGDGKDGKDQKDNGKDGKDQNGGGNGKDQQDSGKDGKDQNDSRKDGKDQKDSGKDGKDQKGSGKNAGSGDDDLYDRSLIEELSRHAESVCKRFSESISGHLGEFANKCKISKRLKSDGLMMNAKKGSTEWNKALELECKRFLKQKLEHQKKYRDTYSRVRRGERSFTAQDMANRRVIVQGREEVRQKIGFDLSLFIDVSGSMDSCIDQVFKSAYSITDNMKEIFGKEKIVDKNKINLKSYVFTERMRQIKYGTKVSASGGTYSLNNLISDIHTNGAVSFINICITDGEFSSWDVNTVVKLIGDMEGLFIIVTNNKQGTFDDLVKAVNAKWGPKLKVIYADSNFTIG